MELIFTHLHVGEMGDFTVEIVDECGNPITDPNHLTVAEEFFGCGGGGAGYPIDFENPDNTNYLACADNNLDSWVDNIFGRTYVCEYFFNSNHKLRTIYAAEDFYFFTDVYTQAKFKKQGFLGFWFSNRDASTVYILNKKAILQTERKKRGFNLSVNLSTVRDIFNEIKAFFTSNPDHKIVSVTNVYDMETNIKTSFIASPSVLISNASTTLTAYTPPVVNNSPFIDFNLKGFFGQKVNKAITVNILGLSASLSNTQIIQLSHQILSGHNASQYSTTGTGAIVFTYQNPENLEEMTPMYYCLYGEKSQVYNLAVARRDFNIPEDFEIDDLTIGFRSTHSNATGTTNNYVGLKFNFLISVVTSADLEIESGAYFDNRWGGSKFKIKY